MSRTSHNTFPDFVLLDETKLSAAADSICIIDPQGTILWTNPAWHAFAAENGAARVSHSWRSYLAPIPPPLRGFYEAAFREALASGDVLEHEYECSSPEVARRFRMRALPIEARGLVLEHSLVSALTHPEDHAAEIEAHYLDESGIVSQCAHCRRVRHPRSGALHWVPALVGRPHSRTSHMLCAACAGFYLGPHRRRRRR
jgi:hypothetical protein